ncbi:probable RNA-binding protein 18 [Plodia interpunctella]|uniref:probable RNA-binding protein 18 n=1 Tax=Plodia interpunctella TaxID=58824 RepID=UPI00236855E5|nr:probable RNA-binding protein 18 [Plodia interpunctella]
MDNATMPLHLEPIHQSEVCEKRLWIGNLDTRVNEYQLLKMVRVYGNIEKFDMLFHRSGPNIGQPRGFAFVTYKLRQDAISAMNSLNGQLLGSKRICVKFAKNTEDQEKPKPELGIAALAGAKPEMKLSRKTAIQSIEAKLKMMESMKPGDDFVINKLAANETPIIAQYQTKQHQPPNKSVSSFRRRHPYHKKR